LLTKSPDEIINEITEHLKLTYRLQTNNAEPNHFGYANLKWKIDTDQGVFFVKQYNSERYSDQLLEQVEVALGLQEKLNLSGIPCPKILSRNGTYIQRTALGERYMITEFSAGQMINPGEANVEQMYHLGQVTGNMHYWLDQNAPKTNPLHWTPNSKEQMLSVWLKNWKLAQNVESEKYIAALEIQRKITDDLDLNIFQHCEEGWVHWDLFVDNILFHPKSVAAILDFDRMHFIYPEFDISRAILSGAIINNQVNLDSSRAFISGYRESIPLSLSKLIRSIKLTWWKEAAWLSVQSEEHRTLKRFAEELIWVSNNWSMLNEIFSD